MVLLRNLNAVVSPCSHVDCWVFWCIRSSSHQSPSAQGIHLFQIRLAVRNRVLLEKLIFNQISRYSFTCCRAQSFFTIFKSGRQWSICWRIPLNFMLPLPSPLRPSLLSYLSPLYVSHLKLCLDFSPLPMPGPGTYPRQRHTPCSEHPNNNLITSSVYGQMSRLTGTREVAGSNLRPEIEYSNRDLSLSSWKPPSKCRDNASGDPMISPLHTLSSSMFITK